MRRTIIFKNGLGLALDPDYFDIRVLCDINTVNLITSNSSTLLLPRTTTNNSLPRSFILTSDKIYYVKLCKGLSHIVLYVCARGPLSVLYSKISNDHVSWRRVKSIIQLWKHDHLLYGAVIPLTHAINSVTEDLWTSFFDCTFHPLSRTSRTLYNKSAFGTLCRFPLLMCTSSMVGR